MQKHTLFAFFFILCSVLGKAQKHEPPHPQKDNINFEGYKIRLIPSEGNGYGYAIFKANELLVHQAFNPFTMSPNGLDSKEDAYKVAKWEAAQLKKQKDESPNAGNPAERGGPAGKDLPPSLLNRLPQGKARYNQPIPASVAKELHININPTTSKN